MDQATLVEPEITDGRRFLERLSGEGVPVATAAWVKESEGGPWYFYIVTPLVTEGGRKRPAYRRVGDVLHQMPQPFWVDPMTIMVIASDSDLGRAIREVAEHRPGPVPTPYGSVRLGRLSIDGAYVYPPVAATVV